MRQDQFKKSSVMIIGISGGSGSGKTTFARMLQAHLGESICGILAQDSYYYDHSAIFDHDGGSVNFDHPDAVEFSLMIQHLRALRQGLRIEVPAYDFAHHSRLPKGEYFDPKPIVIVDGILLFSQPELLELLDVSFFVDTHEDLRFQRRLGRDVKERGRKPDGVFKQFYSQVKPMHDLYVEPYRSIADKIISGEKSFGPVINEFVYGLRENQPHSVNPQL